MAALRAEQEAQGKKGAEVTVMLETLPVLGQALYGDVVRDGGLSV